MYPQLDNQLGAGTAGLSRRRVLLRALLLARPSVTLTQLAQLIDDVGPIHDLPASMTANHIRTVHDIRVCKYL